MYVVVPGPALEQWELTGTTVVEGMVNGADFGRRTFKAWGKGSRDWFFELTAPFLAKAKLEVGEEIRLEVRLADQTMPAELQGALAEDEEALLGWKALTDRERREYGEHIRAGKASATRCRRAAAITLRLRRKGRE
ncbi:MAG: YdeI/OmpD-associated family protein [Chromatiales bacterium]|nr:YdeI/OmpD-associated family protein [Chromatiales bacterium]